MSVARFLMWMVIVLVALASLTTGLVALVCESTTEFIMVMMINFFGLILLAPTVVILHRPGFRAGGLFLIPVFITIWAGFLMLAFSPDFLRNRGSDLQSTMFVGLFMAIPAAIAVMNIHRPWGKWFGWVFGGLTLLTIPPVLFAIWARDFDSQLRDQIGQSGGSAFLILGTGAVCLLNLGQKDRRYFRWAGVILSLAAFTCVSILIWKYNELWERSVTRLWAEELWVGAGILGMVNLLLMTWHRGLVRWLQWIAIACTGATGIALGVGFWYDFVDHDRHSLEFISRLVGAGGSLTVGSIVIMLTARTMLRLRKPTSPEGISQVALTCPVCGTAQTTGFKGACTKCHLQFSIRLIEPRCTNCQHLLLNLASDRCPECGLAVPVRPITPPIAPTL